MPPLTIHDLISAGGWAGFFIGITFATIQIVWRIKDRRAIREQSLKPCLVTNLEGVLPIRGFGSWNKGMSPVRCVRSQRILVRNPHSFSVYLTFAGLHDLKGNRLSADGVFYANGFPSGHANCGVGSPILSLTPFQTLTPQIEFECHSPYPTGEHILRLTSSNNDGVIEVAIVL